MTGGASPADEHQPASRPSARRGRWLLIGAAAGTLALFPLVVSNTYWQGVLFSAFLLAVVANGWNLISGYGGFISLGQSAFIGVGGYTVALLAIRWGVSPLILAPIGGLAAALLAAILGAIAMRSRGHAFVIITIAFLFLMQVIALNWASLTNGSHGLSLPLPRWDPELANVPFYYAMLGILLLSALLSWAVRRTKFGMGLIAIREDEHKAATIGIVTPVYKLIGFVLSAVPVGVAGAVYAYYLSFIDPRGMFDIQFSVRAVLAALLGGAGTVLGPLLGAFLLQGMIELSNAYFGATQAHIVIVGALTVAIVLFLPDGILTTLAGRLSRRRSRDPSHTPVARAPASARGSSGPGRALDPALSTNQTPRVILEVSDLHKRFGGLKAVESCDFSVAEGTITGLVGPNGSGKTTVFNLVDGTVRADGGRVFLSGDRIDVLAPWTRSHLGLGRTFQITRLFKKMTVLENVVAPVSRSSWKQLAARAVSGPELERALEALDFVGVVDLADNLAGALSFGQQKLVELAQVMMLGPKLILLDEPAGGINPTLIERIAAKIRDLQREGITFLIVEHNMPLVLDLCDPILVLAEGRCIARGTPGEIQRDPAVLDAYLGEGWGAVGEETRA